MKFASKFIFKLILFFLLTIELVAREQGQTEITTEDGVEVYQEEKYYLLKKNVKIESDNFILSADDVRINFDKNLYDITFIKANKNVLFNSLQFGMNGSGESLDLFIETQDLVIKGYNSELITQEITMYSDSFINVNNLTGNFKLKGSNSKLISDNILIKAGNIEGVFTNINNQRQISKLNVSDKNISYIKNNNTEMYAKKINFDNKTNIIELVSNVTIIRNGEKITGEYGTINISNNSYKIKSNDQKKVKVIIQNNE